MYYDIIKVVKFLATNERAIA